VFGNNLIINCDRGVAFGNTGRSTANVTGERLAYVDDGVIRIGTGTSGADIVNNLVHGQIRRRVRNEPVDLGAWEYDDGR
jgi:hypothetical protein